MIRKAAAVLAVSSFSLLAVACGAAPGEGADVTEATGAASQALVSSCANTPFTELEQGTYGGGHGGPGGPPGGGGSQQMLKLTPQPELVYSYCQALTNAPVAPPVGYSSNVVASCAGLGVVQPPAGLPAGCTAGYLDVLLGAYDSVFLCPLVNGTVTLPPNSGPTRSNPYAALVTWSLLTNPVDGCLGLPIDPTSWVYVLEQESGGGSQGHCAGNCGGF